VLRTRNPEPGTRNLEPGTLNRYPVSSMSPRSLRLVVAVVVVLTGTSGDVAS
jgi:hypothetical protein